MSEITTILDLGPLIKQYFDPYLLDPLYGLLRRFEDKIIPYANKKIRSQDTGKKREFEKLTIQIREEYERKKAEKKEYDEKIKNSKKRPDFPGTKATMRFKRFSSQQ